MSKEPTTCASITFSPVALDDNEPSVFGHLAYKSSWGSCTMSLFCTAFSFNSVQALKFSSDFFVSKNETTAQLLDTLAKFSYRVPSVNSWMNLRGLNKTNREVLHLSQKKSEFGRVESQRKCAEESAQECSLSRLLDLCHSHFI